MDPSDFINFYHLVGETLL